MDRKREVCQVALNYKNSYGKSGMHCDTIIFSLLNPGPDIMICNFKEYY